MASERVGDDVGHSDVDIQRTAHVQRVMDRLVKSSTMYGIFMADISLQSVSRGTVTTQMVLSKDHLNSKGGLHGAVSATIIDFTTGPAIASWDMRETTGASVDMHISYLSTAKAGDTVEIITAADRVGGNLAFVTISISKIEENGTRTLVTQGRHTKFVRGTAPSPASSQPQGA